MSCYLRRKKGSIEQTITSHMTSYLMWRLSCVTQEKCIARKQSNMVTSPKTYYVVAFVTSFSDCWMVSSVSKFARVNTSLHSSFSFCSLSLPNNMKNSLKKKAKIEACYKSVTNGRRGILSVSKTKHSESTWKPETLVS